MPEGGCAGTALLSSRARTFTERQVTVVRMGVTGPAWVLGTGRSFSIEHRTGIQLGNCYADTGQPETTLTAMQND